MAGIQASEIAWLAVYPPLGVARVGDASGFDEYTLAPQVIGGRPDSRGGFQTEQGRIKRQAVRFHIYARLQSGETVEVVHGDGVTITWRVQVANLKAGWYEFLQAMDLPTALVQPAARRNNDHGRREELDIRPTVRTISGVDVFGAEHRFDDGMIVGRAVALGELRTDSAGRLLFLGGHGLSQPFVPGTKPTTYANNNGWHDDVSDGPVRASVTVGDTVFEADPGYVVVAPPNYAPGITGLVTLDDTVRETFMAAGWLPRPTSTSFSGDIWPIFERLTGMQWTNHGFLMAHGVGSPLDARAEAVIARLSDASQNNESWRRRVFALFRSPDTPGQASHRQIPYIYGDLFGVRGAEPASTFLSVTPTMYDHLRRWAEGAFGADWRGVPALPDFAALPPQEQVVQLSRAGLTECLGGPFHPGIELTWPMRRRDLWALHGTPEAGDRLLYRLNVLDENDPVRQDYGPQLTRDECLGPAGPLRAAGPGALTRWLGVPWQTDEASCNSSADYAPSTFLSFPTYWGARVPDQVLSSAAFTRAGVTLRHLSDDPGLQRLKHAFYREDWLRDVRGRNYFERIDRMVTLWSRLGVVEPVSTPAALRENGFPDISHVETGRDHQSAGSDEKVHLIGLIEELSEPAPQADIAAMAPPAEYVPPRHQFGQGEI